MARLLGDSEERGALVLGEHPLGVAGSLSSVGSGVGGGAGVTTRRSKQITGKSVPGRKEIPRRGVRPTTPRQRE